ncbi:MAG TPA: hypothetical protein VI357_09480 [Mycobacteriales bacterium]
MDPYGPVTMRTIQGRRGVVCDVAIGAGDWSGRDVYVSGPPAMVPVSVDMLRRHGVPLARISYDPIATPVQATRQPDAEQHHQGLVCHLW